MADAPLGRVWLVGAGPGDPGLITVAGAEALAHAEVVVYDRLVNPRLLDIAPKDAERIFAGKFPKHHTMTQDEINALLIDRARAGKRVVRLKGGDPFVFGRGGEEAQALVEAGIPFEVVPGVTSPIAAAAYAGIPVTHRGLASSVAFVTGHEDPTKDEASVDWAKLATAVDTLVLMMSIGQLPGIVERLIAAGREPATPAAVVEWGTLPRQRTLTGTLAGIAAQARDAGIGSEAVVVVGEVVRLRSALRWFESRPLFGLRVLVTRTREQASELSRALAAAGAEPVELPTIQIVPRYDETRLLGAVQRLHEAQYHWLVFTSANAVDIFFDFLWAQNLDARSAGAGIAAIGPATAEALARRGLRADLVAEAYTAEGLLAAFASRGELRGHRVLLPRAEGARSVLVEGLEAQGATVDEVTLYAAEAPQAIGAEGPRPEPAEGLARLRAGEIDVVTFASSSAVRNLEVMLAGDLEPLRRVRIACIGPITAATVEQLLGRAPDVVASEHTIAGLVRALEEDVATR